MALYLLLKAVVTKTITVPQYTRADGTIVPAHQKTVHYDPDHTQEDVINGRGTHSQRLAHEQLKKHKDWNNWSDDEKEAHVRAHGMDIHKKRMQADAVSRFKAAFGKEGKMPQSGHYLAFLNESPEKQEKILDGLKKKHGETHVHNIMDKLHERSVKNGDKQPEKTAEQPKQAEQKPQQKPEAKPVQKPEKQPEQESTGPSLKDAYGMLTDEEKKMLNSDVNADATFRANIGKTDIHEKMQALDKRPIKKISSQAERKARSNESKALQLAHKVTLAHAQKQTAQQEQKTAEKPAEQPKKSNSEPSVEQAFDIINTTLKNQLDTHLNKTGPKQIERVQAFVEKIEANIKRISKQIKSGEAPSFSTGSLKAMKEFLPWAKNTLEKLIEQKEKDDKEAAHMKQFPHIRGVKVPEGLDEAGTKHFKEYLRRLAYSSDVTDFGAQAKEFIRQAKVGIKSYEEKLKVSEFYRDNFNDQKAALAAAEALDGIASDPNFQKKILNAREKAYGKQEEPATQQKQKKTDTGPKEGDVKTVNGKQYVLQGGRWRRVRDDAKADKSNAQPKQSEQVADVTMAEQSSQKPSASASKEITIPAYKDPRVNNPSYKRALQTLREGTGSVRQRREAQAIVDKVNDEVKKLVAEQKAAESDPHYEINKKIEDVELQIRSQEDYIKYAEKHRTPSAQGMADDAKKKIPELKKQLEELKNQKAGKKPSSKKPTPQEKFKKDVDTLKEKMVGRIGTDAQKEMYSKYFDQVASGEKGIDAVNSWMNGSVLARDSYRQKAKRLEYEDYFGNKDQIKDYEIMAENEEKCIDSLWALRRLLEQNGKGGGKTRSVISSNEKPKTTAQKMTVSQALNGTVSDAVRALPVILKKHGTGTGTNKTIKVNGSFNRNCQITALRSYKGKMYADLYWQGDDTDGYESVEVNPRGGKVPADTFHDGYRTRVRHGDLNVTPEMIHEAIKLAYESSKKK